MCTSKYQLSLEGGVAKMSIALALFSWGKISHTFFDRLSMLEKKSCFFLLIQVTEKVGLKSGQKNLKACFTLMTHF